MPQYLNGNRKSPMAFVSGAGIKVSDLSSVGWLAIPQKTGGEIYMLMLLFKSGRDITVRDSPEARLLFEDLTGREFHPDMVILTGNANANP